MGSQAASEAQRLLEQDAQRYRKLRFLMNSGTNGNEAAALRWLVAETVEQMEQAVDLIDVNVAPVSADVAAVARSEGLSKAVEHVRVAGGLFPESKVPAELSFEELRELAREGVALHREGAPERLVCEALLRNLDKVDQLSRALTTLLESVCATLGVPVQSLALRAVLGLPPGTIERG